MSKTRMGKRVASLLLSLVMMLSLLPTTVYAEGADTGATNDAVVEETIAPVNAEGVDAVAQEAESSEDEQSGEEGNEAGNEGETSVTYVAQVGDERYKTLDAAITAVEDGATVTLLDDVNANVEIAAGKNLTLDLNGHTLNGGTADGKPALLNKGTVTIKDSSADQNGKICREDNGAKGYYVIDNQGTMIIESGHIYNSTGNMPEGSSLIRNAGLKAPATLTIKGGDIRQDGFIAIKNDDHGILYISGGTITTTGDTSTNTASAVQNWATAEITGGTINGAIWTSVWSNDLPASVTTIKDATVTGKIIVEPYTSDITTVPTLNIEGGTYTNTSWDVRGNGVVAVSGGTFKAAVPEDYCAEGYIPTKNEDGSYGVKEEVTSNAVAKIGTVEYETLKEAINAANTGDTVTLLAEVNLTSAQAISKKLTIDLNGKTISSTANRTIQLNAGADLTVKDNASGGTIANTSTEKYPSTIYLNGAGAKFTLESGTIESDPNVTSLQSVAINSEKNKACEVNIKGGSVTVPEAATKGRAIVASTNSMTLNISGGTIAGGLHGVDAYSGSNVTITGGEITARVVDTGRIEGAYGMRIIGTANVTVAGGEITGVKMDDDGYKLNVPNVTLKSGKINGSFYSITRGTITFTVDDNATITFVNDSAKKFLPGTVELVRNTDGTYSIKAGTYVAQIGSTGYATLVDAIAAAKDGDTVTLLQDCSGDGIVVDVGKFATKGLTVDFGGHSYTVGGKLVGSTGTASNGFQLNKDNKITFKNGAIYGDASVAGDDETDWTGAPAIMIQNYCDLTLTGMTISGGEETVYTMSNNNGNVVIKDSTITAGKASSYGSGPFAFDVCRYASYPSVTVTVKGNSVINGDVEVSGTIGEDQSRQLYVEGGKFTGKFKVSGEVPANITVSGGTFSSAVPEGLCAEGYIPTKNEDGSYGVKKGSYEARVDGTGYEDVDEALTVWAANGGTLTLLDDCTTDAGASGSWYFNVQKTATLDLNGKTLTLGANKYIGTPYDENNPQTLTIQDSAEGGKLIGTYFYVIQGSWSTTVIVNGGEICNTNNKGALLNNGPVVVNGGKLTGGTYGVSTNSDFTMTKGEINILTLNARVATAELGAVDGVYTDVKIGTLTAGSNNTTVNFNSGIVDTYSISYYIPTLNTRENAYFVNTFTKGLPSGKMLKAVEKDGANYYQLADLTEADAAAKVTAADGTTTLYADAGTAASALRAGGTLTLLKDHNGDTLRVNKDVTGSVTIDLNGKTVTNSDGPALYVVINGSSDDTEPYTVTVRGGGTLKSENNVALRVSAVNNAADVVVEDMTLNPAADQTAIDLQNAARLAYTDEATAQAQIGNGYVVTVDGKNYAFGISGGFVYAVKQLPAAGGTVKLLDNYAGSQKLSYTNDTGKPVVLDLNGKTYSYTSKGGTAALEFARSNSNLTVKNGTIISAATYAVCGVLTPNYPSSSANDLKLTLDGVTLNATNGSGLGVNGTLTGNETVIKNSIIEAADTGIYYPTAGTLTIENSTITGAKLGVAVKGGTVNISGDMTAISATADAKEPANYYTGGDGAIEAEGYALYVEGGYSYDITLNIAGGTFESKGDAVKKFVKDEDTLATRTIAISGGTYSTEPKEAWVVNGYRAINNGDGTYTVAEGEYTVQVTSDTTTGTGSMATVSGGGKGSINSAVEVSAPAVSGYTFVGWYLNSYNGEKLSDQPKYTYKPTADCTLVAVYEIPAGGTFKLTVDGQGINVNNDAQGNHYLAYLAVGSEITLECTNDNFMFWVNSSDNIVSTKKVLTITLVGDSAYRAVTADNGNDFALVIFKNTQSSGGQELSAARYTSESTISFPANPSLYGRTFKNWAFMDDTNTVATESAIQERIKACATSIIVVPVFEVTGTYTVTVQYVDKANEKIAESTVSESQYTGAMIKVEAKPMIDGKYFSHWADESGEVVLSTKQTYVVCAVTNTTIKAVYVTNESDKEQAADKVTLTTNASKNSAKWRVTLVMNYAITDDHTILQRGFLYWPTNTDLSVENKEYLKYREWGGTDSNNGATVLNLNTSNPGKMIYARAYVIVKDASGNTQTIYSEPIAVSYNIITGATGN